MPDVNIEIFSPNANLLLTSAGLTTDAMKDRAQDMRSLAGRKPSVLRLTDGWRHFRPTPIDQISKRQRMEHWVENSVVDRGWSRYYLLWTFGFRASVDSVSLCNDTPEHVESLLDWADILVVPGGNTYQTLRGIKPHKQAIKNFVAEGKPFIGESDGSIVAGQTIAPAAVEPADALPSPEILNAQGLDIVHADIVVHAAGAEGPFDLPLSRVAKLMLDMFASDAESYQSPEGAEVVMLNDKQALSVEDGEARIIG